MAKLDDVTKASVMQVCPETFKAITGLSSARTELGPRNWTPEQVRRTYGPYLDYQIWCMTGVTMGIKEFFNFITIGLTDAAGRAIDHVEVIPDQYFGDKGE